MTTGYELLARVEALEMNTEQTGALLITINRMATDFAALNRTVEAIYDVLRDMAELAERLEATEDDPDA